MIFKALGQGFQLLEERKINKKEHLPDKHKTWHNCLWHPSKKMKFAKVMKYWQKDQLTLMEALIQKHSFLQRGYRYAGISAIQQTSPEFDRALMKNLQRAEEVAMIPLFKSNLSLFLGGRETILEGMYSFYAIFPEEEEEEIPDTLPGGFRAEQQVNPENPASPFKTIKRALPSELLCELDKNIILYENVKEFYFEPYRKENENRQFKHTLTIEDVILLSRMEKGNELDSTQLRSRQSSPEERKTGKRLDDHLSRSPLVIRVARSNYALSQEAFDGMYVAVVHKKYLPE